MRHHVLVVALVMFLVSGRAERASAEERVERNVVFGMYSGLALLMDVYYPENPNGYGIVFISGSGWTRELSLDATPLKESGQEDLYAVPRPPPASTDRPSRSSSNTVVCTNAMSIN